MKSKEQVIREILERHPEHMGKSYAVIEEIKSTKCGVKNHRHVRRNNVPSVQQCKQIMRRILKDSEKFKQH